MIIADKEGHQALGNLCHVALKTGGYANYPQVKTVEMQVTDLKEKPKEEEPKDDGE